MAISKEAYFLLSGVALHMMIFFQFPFGYLIDRYGSRQMATISIFLSVIGVLIFPISVLVGFIISFFINETRAEQRLVEKHLK